MDEGPERDVDLARRAAFAQVQERDMARDREVPVREQRTLTRQLRMARRK